MPRFNYLAEDNQGRHIKGSLEAKDKLEAQAKLREMNLYIIWLHGESNLLNRLGLWRVKNLDLAIAPLCIIRYNYTSR